MGEPTSPLPRGAAGDHGGGLRGSCGEGVDWAQAGDRGPGARGSRPRRHRSGRRLGTGARRGRDAGADLHPRDPAVLTDLNSLENGQELQADLVIVGAGAAGISLALEFLDSHHQVLLVESGNLEADADTQSLDEGSVIGLTYPPLEAARARYFGGTTNMWTGWCKPLDPIDLRAAPLARPCRLADRPRGVAALLCPRPAVGGGWAVSLRSRAMGRGRRRGRRHVRRAARADFLAEEPADQLRPALSESAPPSDERHRPAQRKPDRDPDNRRAKASSKVSSCVQ